MAENNSSAPLKTALPTDVEAFEHFVSDCDGAGIQYDGPSYEQGFLSGKVVGMDAAQAVATQAAPAAVHKKLSADAGRLAYVADQIRALEPVGSEGDVFLTEVIQVLKDCAEALTTPALPATEDSSAGDLADWRTPTSYLHRFREAITLVCRGKTPPDNMLTEWLAGDSEELQDFAATHAPAWAQGIGAIEAATLMADQPTAGVEHEFRDEPQPQAEVQAEPVAWDGKLPESLQRALNEMRVHCKPHIVSGLEFEVRQVFEGMHTSLSTVRRMYWAANARLEEIEEAQPDPFAAPQAQPADTLDAKAPTLVEILAAHWTTWPAEQAVEQTVLGDVFCCVKGRALKFGTYQIASDQDSAVVTPSQWTRQRAAMAAAQEGGNAANLKRS